MDLTELVQHLSAGYMWHQTAVITAFFVLGMLVVRAFGGRLGEDRVTCFLLAFPSGFSLFSVAAYLMLCLGIPYDRVSVNITLAAAGLCCMGVIIRRCKKVDITIGRSELIGVFIGVAAVLVVGIMLTSNVFDVALDNDSLYYFSTYPEAIVVEKGYIRYFDVFLTDASPIGSIVHTLPYIYGFSETFGIQYFMDLNFLLIFAYGIYTELSKNMTARQAGICCGVTILFLLTSSAYLTTAKWIMAGVYFMSYYFICAYTGYLTAGIPSGKRPYLLLSMYAVTAAMMRHEGVAMILILVMTLSVLEGYAGKELAAVFILPVTAAAALYYIRVFLILKVYPLYAFLTPLKAAVLLAALVFSGVFLVFLRDRLGERWRSFGLWLLPAVILLGNLGLLVLRRGRYLGNMKMFYLNVRIGAGWGYFGYIAAFAVLLLMIKAVLYRERYLLFFDSLMLSYVFSVFLVSFGRGDSLRKGVGDSGNRVMLTAVPLIVFAVVLRVFDERGRIGKKEDKG